MPVKPSGIVVDADLGLELLLEQSTVASYRPCCDR